MLGMPGLNNAHLSGQANSSSLLKYSNAQDNQVTDGDGSFLPLFGSLENKTVNIYIFS